LILALGVVLWMLLSFTVIEGLNKLGRHWKIYNLGGSHDGVIVAISFFIALTSCIIPIVKIANMVDDQVMVKSYEYNIYAIEDNMGVKGNRYYIETNTNYNYLADYKDGKKQYSVSKNESYIVEDKSARPHIEVYEASLPKDKKNKFTKIIFESVNKEYKIVVPEKTLTNDFNIDLK
jgi:hypothetical protein